MPQSEHGKIKKKNSRHFILLNKSRCRKIFRFAFRKIRDFYQKPPLIYKEEPFIGLINIKLYSVKAKVILSTCPRHQFYNHIFSNPSFYFVFFTKSIFSFQLVYNFRVTMIDLHQNHACQIFCQIYPITDILSIKHKIYKINIKSV